MGNAARSAHAEQAPAEAKGSAHAPNGIVQHPHLLPIDAPLGMGPAERIAALVPAGRICSLMIFVRSRPWCALPFIGCLQTFLPPERITFPTVLEWLRGARPWGGPPDLHPLGAWESDAVISPVRSAERLGEILAIENRGQLILSGARRSQRLAKRLAISLKAVRLAEFHLLWRTVWCTCDLVNRAWRLEGGVGQGPPLRSPETDARLSRH
mmetsp:Transcript_28677/g.62763  ORF Transcript_28677/g.62763 Transcript_28677/m.62763 type:complete len:211 (+) Transcript_28677:126-758(+)